MYHSPICLSWFHEQTSYQQPWFHMMDQSVSFPWMNCTLVAILIPHWNDLGRHKTCTWVSFQLRRKKLPYSMSARLPNFSSMDVQVRYFSNFSNVGKTSDISYFNSSNQFVGYNLIRLIRTIQRDATWGISKVSFNAVQSESDSALADAASM